jgi:trehalose 6-phosphate phosphatase
MSDRLFDSLPDIRSRLSNASHWLLGLDFDGTLAPLVDHPDGVHFAPRMERLIQTLAARPNISVAIVSGRERTDLASRVGIPGLIYAGNHGLDIDGPGMSYVEPTAFRSIPAMQSLAGALDERLRGIAGVFVENKGLTLSIHYRQVAPAEHEEVHRRVQGMLARAGQPLVLTTGVKVYEIRPRTHWNKGAALGWIRDQIGKTEIALIYIGDDTTDEDAFRALADGVTIRVGFTEGTAARYYAESQSEVGAFLEWLASYE